jgi:hypothetical protein
MLGQYSDVDPYISFGSGYRRIKNGSGRPINYGSSRIRIWILTGHFCGNSKNMLSHTAAIVNPSIL